MTFKIRVQLKENPSRLIMAFRAPSVIGFSKTPSQFPRKNQTNQTLSPGQLAKV
jgi:hypothetical protein